MRRRRAPLAAAAVTAAAALGGCGSSDEGPKAARSTTPTGTSSSTAPPPVVGAMVPVVYPNAGVRFAAPEGWRNQPGEPPLVATVQTGQASVAVWRYPRPGDQLPVTHGALKSAELALVAAIRRRDKTFLVTKAKLLHVGPERAVQVLGNGTIGGQRRTIRSTHVFSQGAEFVIDAYAPPTLFPRVDRTVFVPLLASLKISPPRA